MHSRIRRPAKVSRVLRYAQSPRPQPDEKTNAERYSTLAGATAEAGAASAATSAASLGGASSLIT